MDFRPAVADEEFRDDIQFTIEKLVDKVDPLALLTEFLTRNEVELHVKIGIKPRIPGGTTEAKD